MILVSSIYVSILPKSSWEELIPLVSPVVVILLFLIERIIGFNLRKKEIDRSWYFKVLIEPGIDKISEFYKTTNKYYSDAALLLQSNKSTAHDEYGKLKATEFFKFQELKRSLEAEVIQPIMSRYPFIGNSLTTILITLEDIYTSSLDLEKFSKEEVNKIYLEIFGNRAELLNQLYFPLQPNPNIFVQFYNRFKSTK